MLPAKILGVGDGDGDGDGDKARFAQSEISPLLKNIPASTSVLVVDSNFIDLHDMKKTMQRYGYQVTVYVDAEEALRFLKNCQHEINIVIWDFHMPKINGLEALKIINPELDLPVVIMSDDGRTESVLDAMISGACYYVTKPVRETVIANIWQHIVRKKIMTKPDLIQPVQSDLVQSDCFDQNNNGDSKTVEQDNGEEEIIMENKAAKKPRTESDLVQSDGLDHQDSYGSTSISLDNSEENIDRKGKKPRKERLTWSGKLHHKFLEAIEDIGGMEKANPKVLLKRMQEMNIEGLNRSNVASHLQKHRISLEEKIISQQNTQEMRRSSDFRPSSSLLGLNNVGTAMSSSYVRNPFQQNQYSNGYLTMNNNNNNNQFMTNPRRRLPYVDHYLLQQQKQQQQQQQLLLLQQEQQQQQQQLLLLQQEQEQQQQLQQQQLLLLQQQQQQQQQQYQLSHELNYVIDKKEPEQAFGTDLDTYPELFFSNSFDPDDILNFL